MSRNLKTALKHIRRSPYQALAALTVLSLCFFIGIIFISVTLGFGKILKYFETRPQVTAFFVDNATQEQIDQLTKSLQDTGFISQSKFISKEEALAIYREQNKDNPLLLEMVTADILPASLEVSSNDVSHLPQLAQIMAEAEGVEEVIYHQDIIERLAAWTKTLRISAVVLISVLALTALLIVIIIISMKIAHRRQEIAILKLIGASNSYIKYPFLIEGALYGFFGSLTAWFVWYLLFLYSTPFLVNFLGSIPLIPIPFLYLFLSLILSLGCGVFVGVVGSFLAIQRFLK